MKGGMAVAQTGRKYEVGRVSVVTPVYNGEGHVARILESILQQTYLDIEMVLVDDGSFDKTLCVAESYRERFEEKGYRYHIVQAGHKNASAAINQGLPYVTGEYLIWPDSDDVLQPESVEKRVAFLKECPQYQCVRSLSYYFYEATGMRSEKEDEQKGDLQKEDLFWDILESRTFVCCGCYMLKSEAFFDIYPERRIPEYDVGQNFQMLLPFMFRHKCPTLQEELYGVSIREGSHSRIKLTQAQEEKKYSDYEHLIDDIAAICHITDKYSKDRIDCWKVKRRYFISLKYGRKKQAVAAMYRLRRYQGWRLPGILKEALRICFCTKKVL